MWLTEDPFSEPGPLPPAQGHTAPLDTARIIAAAGDKAKLSSSEKVREQDAGGSPASRCAAAATRRLAGFEGGPVIRDFLDEILKLRDEAVPVLRVRLRSRPPVNSQRCVNAANLVDGLAVVVVDSEAGWAPRPAAGIVHEPARANIHPAGRTRTHSGVDAKFDRTSEGAETRQQPRDVCGY
jgi:hypothetical protein